MILEGTYTKVITGSLAEVMHPRDALTSGFKQNKIAKYFGLHQSTLSLIKNKINWSC